MKNHTIQRLSYGLMSFMLAITFLVSGCGGVPPHPSGSSTSIHVQSKSLLVGAWLGIPSTFTEPVAAFTAAIHQFEVDSGHHLDVINIYVDMNYTPFSVVAPYLQAVD